MWKEGNKEREERGKKKKEAGRERKLSEERIQVIL